MKKCSNLTEANKAELSEYIRSNKDGLEVRRAQAVLLIDRGTKLSQIGDITGFSRRQPFFYRKRYLQGGLKGLANKRKGHPKRLLTRGQRQELVEILSRENPKAYGYDQEYWSTGLVADFVLKRYKVQYASKTSYYVMFKEAKLSFHKPGRVYEKYDRRRAILWRFGIRKQVAKWWAEKDTVILCEDEMVLSSQTTFQKVWLKVGEYPKIEISNTKVNKSIYGFLNVKRGKVHAFCRDRQNMHITKDILQEIRAMYPDKKIILLWDGAGWHRGSVVKDYLALDSKMESHHFPAYSPEENPQEHVWKAGRSMVTHNQFIPDIEKAATDFVAYLNQNSFHYKLIRFSAPS